MVYLPPISKDWIRLIDENILEVCASNPDYKISKKQISKINLHAEKEVLGLIDYLLINNVLEIEYDDDNTYFLAENGFAILEGNLQFTILEKEERSRRPIGLVEEIKVKKSIERTPLQWTFISLFLFAIGMTFWFYLTR